MPRVEIKICFCLLLFSVACKAEELSTGVVYDLLSRRLDDVIQETRTLKSELADTVNTIENKIEKFEENIATLATNADFEKRIESYIEKQIMKFKDTAKSEVHDKLNRQTAVVHKMLSNEKILLRDEIERLKATKTEITNLVDTKLQEGEEKIDETSSRLMRGIIDVNETVSKTKSDLQSSIRRVSSQLNNAESRLSSAESADRQLSSKLSTIERNQKTQEINLDSRISQLSTRVSKEEARKVAFSTRLTKKKSYYGKFERIVFDEVIYSYGGGYSSSTGIFTAPKSGTYLFTFNIQAASNGFAHVLLTIGGRFTTGAMTYRNRENGGNAAVYYLSAGNTAYVQTASLEDKYYIWPYRTTFNGVLID